MSNKEKLKGIAKEDKNKTLEAIKWRRENRAWLRRSQGIALKILKTLREKSMSQKDLAAILDVSPQQVNKWLKGKENFRLDTISKFELALDIKLIELSNKPNTRIFQMGVVTQKVVKEKVHESKFYLKGKPEKINVPAQPNYIKLPQTEVAYA